MILIEIGNTSVKAVKDTDGDRSPLFKIGTDDNEGLREELTKLNRGSVVILSSVRKDLSELMLEYSDNLKIQVIDRTSLGRINIDYKTPETLGIDRVLACAGGVAHSGSDVVVVDAGTACTIDFMSADYTFRGGVILPGLPVLRHSMRSLAPELPDVDQELPDMFPGKSTREAIQFGLNGGFIHAVSSFVGRYVNEHGDAKVLVTGGDGPFVQASLENTYGSDHFENLVFDGMLAWKKINQV